MGRALFRCGVALILVCLLLVGCKKGRGLQGSNTAGTTDFINFTDDMIRNKTIASTEPEQINSINFVFREDSFSPLPTPGPEKP
jgi:hypothetical protein